MIHKLKTKVNIDDLRNYYNTVVNDYQHLCWYPDNHVSDTNSKWGTKSMTDRVYGWGIDTNLEDLESPSPPYNISMQPKLCVYRNTRLAFGVITHLQELFPFGYRWSISVQQPGGFVNKHSDNPDNLTVWIPIYNPAKAGLIMYDDDIAIDNHLPSDGSLYLVHTEIPHETYNDDTTDRVLLSFRFLVEHLDEVISK